MNLAPLLSATAPIPSHAIAAMMALILGGVQLYLPKIGQRHRWMGRVWVVLIAYVALSSFFIHELNMWRGYSIIHLLSVFTLVMLVRAVYLARVGKVKEHKITMKALYFYALIIAGFFTLLPGRVMYNVIFG